MHDLEIIEVVLVNCNIFKNDYQHEWLSAIVFYTLVPNESSGLLLDISPKMLLF